MSYTAKVIAVLGRTLRAGRWKLADDSLVIAVFGRCVLDLNRAYVDEDDDELYMKVFCLFGSVSVILPPGCDVEPSGIALLASSEVEIPSEKSEDITQDVLAPLDISWFAMFGRVRINEFVLEPDEPDVSELGPPPTEVFGDPDEIAAANAAAAAAAERAEAAERAAEEKAAEAAAAASAANEDALRDELAQWRSEKGEPDPVPDPESEIDTEAGAADTGGDEADADAASSGASPDETDAVAS